MTTNNLKQTLTGMLLFTSLILTINHSQASTIPSVLSDTANHGSPNNTNHYNNNDCTKRLLQFTGAGHILGFGNEGMISVTKSRILKLSFVNANRVCPVSDTNNSKKNDTTFAKSLTHITYKNIWDGITLVYESNGSNLISSSYILDFSKKGVQANSIRFNCNRSLKIDNNGNLEISYENGKQTLIAPVAWQETAQGLKTVWVSFVLFSEHEFGFSLGEFKSGIPVVIAQP